MRLLLLLHLRATRLVAAHPSLPSSCLHAEGCPGPGGSSSIRQATNRKGGVKMGARTPAGAASRGTPRPAQRPNGESNHNAYPTAWWCWRFLVFHSLRSLSPIKGGGSQGNGTKTANRAEQRKRSQTYLALDGNGQRLKLLPRQCLRPPLALARQAAAPD